MRADRTRLDPRTRLTVPRTPVIQSQHALADRLRHCWIPEWTRGQDRLRNLVRNVGETPVADFSSPAPTWTTGVTSAALSFDGSSLQLLHPAPPAILWNPLLMGGVAYTFAYVGRMKSFGTSGKVLYSHNCSTSGTISLELSVKNTQFRLFATQDSLSGESIAVNLTTVPAVGNLFAVIGTIRDANTSAIAMRDYQGGTSASATDVTGNISSFFVNTVDQESFASWHGGGSPDAGSYADTDMLGVFGWNRAFTDAEMQHFLNDPFGVLRERPRPKYVPAEIIAPGAILATTWNVNLSGAASGASSTPGPTLATNWTLAGGQAAASSAAAGTTQTNTWALFASVALNAIVQTQWSVTAGTAVSSAVGPGVTLLNQVFLLPGQASGNAIAAGQTLSTAWSLTPGQAGGTNTAAGRTYATSWSLSAGGASGNVTISTPRPFYGGGGFGPGGDPAAMARIRQTVERAADRAFDLEGWTKREAEEAAAKMRAAVQAEIERTRPERLLRATSRFLNLTEDD